MRGSLAGLHVLWSLPVTVAAGFPLWFVARAYWCGFGGCWGADPSVLETNPGAGQTLATLWIGLVFAAVAIPPWIRPWWLRAIVGAIVAALGAYIFGWGDAPAPIPFLPNFGFGGIIF